MQAVRTALIGFGGSGQTFHGPLITAAADLNLCAIVTADAARGALARSRYPGAQVYASSAELYAHRADLELVVVATPNDVHVSEALKAVGNGCAVVIDKPFARTVEEAETLLAHASAAGVPMTVFQNRRWDTDHLTVQRLIRDGLLGDVWRYEARYEFYRPGPAPARTDGLLLGLGSHLVDQALVLLGRAARVYAEVETRQGDQDDDTFLAITHDSGATSHIWLSSRAQQFGPRVRVIGSAATFQIDRIDSQEAQLRATQALPSLGEPTEPEENWGIIVADSSRTAVTAEPGRWAGFYPAVASAVRGLGPMPVDPVEALYALQVMQAARGASSSRTVVTL